MNTCAVVFGLALMPLLTGCGSRSTEARSIHPVPDASADVSFSIPSSLDGYVLVLEGMEPYYKGFRSKLFRDSDHAGRWREARIPYGIRWEVFPPQDGRVVEKFKYRKTERNRAELVLITDIPGGCDTRDEWTYRLMFDAPLSGRATCRYWCWEFEREYRDVTFKLVPYRDLIGSLPLAAAAPAKS